MRCQSGFAPVGQASIEGRQTEQQHIDLFTLRGDEVGFGVGIATADGGAQLLQRPGSGVVLPVGECLPLDHALRHAAQQRAGVEQALLCEQALKCLPLAPRRRAPATHGKTLPRIVEHAPGCFIERGTKARRFILHRQRRAPCQADEPAVKGVNRNRGSGGEHLDIELARARQLLLRFA